MKNWTIPKLETFTAESLEELYRLAYYDSLTGFYNRNMLEEIRKQLENEEMHVTIFDIDDLKLQNDFFGHESGDKIIKIVANRLKTLKDSLGLNGYVFRLGGDEFLMLHQGQLTTPSMKGVSEGTIFKDKKMSFKTALAKADEIMYLNKRRNKLESLTPYFGKLGSV